ncbi:hypothetical protein PhCBS80983_g01017 [Powellomyces hirtus]|uniref:Amine oxidase domain-containing protein n=1 Tax=Powellomyces hirtus TaxID=109895 RepID=A0A507EED3_9FUNG|nr:hypothetical protein PhCBS80983_g01017 [Powellomyces hirtus]
MRISDPPRSAIAARSRTRGRVAVIGSGLAGLSTAYLLVANGYAVDVYEKAGRLGLAQASIEISDGEDAVVMDVPMRSFFPEHYEHLARMYAYLGIPTHAADNSISFSQYTTRQGEGKEEEEEREGPAVPTFSFSCVKIPFTDTVVSYPDLSFKHARATPWRALMTVVGYLYFLAIVKWLAWTGAFEKRGHGEVDERLRGLSLDAFWDRYAVRDEFVWGAFMPLFCGVCTCDVQTLGRFPAVEILDYVSRAMPFGKMSFVTPGVQAVCTALTQHVDKIFLDTSVVSVHPTTTCSSSGSPSTTYTATTATPSPRLPPTPEPDPPMAVETADGTTRHYDHVIFATQASQAARILRASRRGADDDTPNNMDAQIELLDAFEYVKTVVVCHTDEELMPRDKALWRCMNFFTHQEYTRRGAAAEVESGSLPTPPSPTHNPFPYNTTTTPTCSHYYNKSDPALTTTAATKAATTTRHYFQTTNPYKRPHPAKTLATTYFERVVVTPRSTAALGRLQATQNEQGNAGSRLWFVGSWAWHGIPLLEGCVASSVAAVTAISNCDAPATPIVVPWLTTTTSSDRKQNAGKPISLRQFLLAFLVGCALSWLVKRVVV